MYNLKAKEAAAKEEEEVMRVNPHPQPSHPAARAVSMIQEAAERAASKVQEAAVPQPNGRCRYCGAAFALVSPNLYTFIMYYLIKVVRSSAPSLVHFLCKVIVCKFFFLLWHCLCQGIANHPARCRS